MTPGAVSSRVAASIQVSDMHRLSAVERAGMSTLIEGQKVSFDIVADRKTGKSAAENLHAA